MTRRRTTRAGLLNVSNILRVQHWPEAFQKSHLFRGHPLGLLIVSLDVSALCLGFCALSKCQTRIDYNRKDKIGSNEVGGVLGSRHIFWPMFDATEKFEQSSTQ